jgi:hypothetical protein
MAIIKRKEIKKITEKDMQAAIGILSPWLSKRYDVIIPNCYTKWDNEADLFCIRPSGFCDEIEIKVSKADFRLDEKKTIKVLNENASRRNRYVKQPKRDVLQDGSMSNYFWYAFPEGLIDYTDVPDWAGIIVVNSSLAAHEVRQPKRLHGRKLTMEEQFKQTKKLGYRFWNLISAQNKT